MLVDLLARPDGGVLLRMAEEWSFPSFEQLTVQLPGVINDFVTRTGGLLILHCGAVRSPAGELIVLPGMADAGKSTLTAALVKAGCDYIGDELIGVRPDTLVAVGAHQSPNLDETSRAVLGIDIDSSGPSVAIDRIRLQVKVLSGDVAPIDRVVAARFDPSVDAIETAALTPREALEALTPAVMNIVRCGQTEWQTLCQLCSDVTVSTLRHPDAILAADLLLARQPGN